MNHILLLAAMTVAGADAPVDQTPLKGLQSCAKVAEADARLACYDREAPILTTALDKKQVVVMTREEVKRTRRTLFGLPLPDLGLFGSSDDSADKADRITEITSKTTSARESGVGRWVFTLAEGSVWETTDASTMTFIRSGQDVTITTSAFGFRARFGKTSWLRVRRLR